MPSVFLMQFVHYQMQVRSEIKCYVQSCYYGNGTLGTLTADEKTYTGNPDNGITADIQNAWPALMCTH